MKYKAIGFDYGGVIVGNPMSGIYFSIGKILDIDTESLKKVYFKNNYLMNIEGLSFEDLWRKLLIMLNKTEKEKELMSFLRLQHNLNINKEVLDIIKNLKIKGCKVGLLSNNTTKVNDEIKNLGLKEYFDITVISEDVGYMKPDAKIFEIFCEKLNIKPNELVFIDDSESSLREAEKIGYTPILFRNAEDLKMRLIDLGIL